ncbi:hypothetical protein BDV95DRAFT_80726 [Massariosphaeria phaeospora]|uniref:Uncharacterized protein n=1 Tax=Massariosphaeria phaeospora TaxID=100035 RepID=A0A7C8MM95_9PLEO|nr:hypothetical protein BDV95DRAFT_80726 [Massariosphaeria phaeospora]
MASYVASSFECVTMSGYVVEEITQPDAQLHGVLRKNSALQLSWVSYRLVVDGGCLVECSTGVCMSVGEVRWHRAWLADGVSMRLHSAGASLVTDPTSRNRQAANQMRSFFTPLSHLFSSRRHHRAAGDAPSRKSLTAFPRLGPTPGAGISNPRPYPISSTHETQPHVQQYSSKHQGISDFLAYLVSSAFVSSSHMSLPYTAGVHTLRTAPRGPSTELASLMTAEVCSIEHF